MKKFLAVIMSLIMMFTLVAIPVSAAQEEKEEVETEETIDIVEVINTLELTVQLIYDTMLQVHIIVGTIMGVLEKECPLCGEIHDEALTDEETEEVPEDEDEADSEVVVKKAA